MKTLELMEDQQRTVVGHDVVVLPYGMLGFERVKNYSLRTNPGEEPFLRLQMQDDSNYSFLLLPAGKVVGNYQPELTEEDLEFLELEDLSDALVLNTVTVGDKRATINLKGPIVINRQTWIGKQVIPVNAGRYSASHPLPVELC